MRNLLFIAVIAIIAITGCKKDKEEFTVTFDSNGGSAVAAQIITKGEKAAKPADPTKEDNTFVGWYKETALTNEWNFATDVVTSNITLYAKWNAVEVIVTNFTVTVLGEYFYLGATIEPPIENVVVKAGDFTLTAGSDYTLAYSNNTNAGTATVTATGAGKYAKGSGEAKFTIYLYFAGKGISTEPYKIGTAEQLAKLAELVNATNPDYNDKYYKLTTDIDLLAYGKDWNDGKGWIPIGMGTGSFMGNFDGNNHKVSELYINDNNLYYTGLFGRIFDGGYVQNLGVVNVNIKGDAFVGGITGAVVGSNITNCYSLGTVIGTDNVGGVVGSILQSNITNCYSTGTISGIQMVGGVLGFVSNGSVGNCYFTGTVSGSDDVGGVVGNIYYHNSNVTNCYSAGTVIGIDNVGGVTGYAAFDSKMTYCYSSSAVNGTNRVGGVAGRIDGGLFESYCVALNPSVKGKTHVGRVVGFDANLLSNNLAYSGMTINDFLVTSADDTSIHGADITTTEATTQITYSGTNANQLGWSFGNNDENPWKWGGDSYPLPVFYWQDASSYPSLPEHLK